VSRVALATSRVALPGAPASLVAHEDVDMPLLIAEFARQGVTAEARVWDDESVDWESYDLVVVRSTWGYADSYPEFLSWAHARARLINPYEVIEYSSDKHYLGDLARQGFPVIATSYCEVGDEPVFPDVDFVVKPAVGAGSVDAARFEATDILTAAEHVARLHASQRCALIQPYVSSIDVNGERALVFLDGEFSHAMTKRAHLNVAPEERDGDFRTRQMSGTLAEPDAVDLARSLMTGRFADLAYGRVDLVKTLDGWQLMELELVEPALFLSYDESAVTRAARAMIRRIS
jgi:glutathione synthase/RimK-type ligase-like ATP-grasp enzyme